jgi:hypothetical protein
MLVIKEFCDLSKGYIFPFSLLLVYNLYFYYFFCTNNNSNLLYSLACSLKHVFSKSLYNHMIYKWIMGESILGWYRYESPCQNHKKVGPNLRNKVLSTYTLVYLIGVGGLCFPHLCTHSWKIVNTQKIIICINILILEPFLTPFLTQFLLSVFTLTQC